MSEKAGWEVEGFIDRLTRRDDRSGERLVLEAISHLRAFSRDCDGLRETNADLRAENERLLINAALGRRIDEENDKLRAEIGRLRAELTWIAERYGEGHPPGDRARAALVDEQKT